MRFPGEWEPHERTIMGWPCRSELWGQTLAQAKTDYAAVANTIAAFEPVTMIANAGADAAEARAALTAGIEVLELPLDDSWLRDCGPIYVVDDAGGPLAAGASESRRRTAVHFGFNAWGEKFPPWDRDAAVGALVAKALGDQVCEEPMVLEGGSVLSDGGGTIVTTEQCLLNPNRNAGMSRAQIERVLAQRLGARRIVWLGKGLVEDRDTDGHIDLIAVLLPGDRVLLQTVPVDNPNYCNCEDNCRRLTGAGFDVIDVPYLPYVEVAGERVAASYLNLYLCNGAAIVPVCGAPSDLPALALIRRALPDREVVPVPGAVIAYGGGGPHCITQQVPAV
jgi:agmatine deiminase